MARNKVVVDMRSTTSGISRGESDEQQRKWSGKQWDEKSRDALSNYDPSRAHLNFQVAHGVVRPIDKSRSIAELMADNLAARGIRDPNARANVRRPQRTVAQFIMGGSRDRMLQLAFGSQQVDLDKGADNSHLVRCEDIERWAVDSYRFLADRFGEDNIISFYVHLDEKNPHVHCTLVPVDPATGRISWKGVFGDGRTQEAASMSELHSSYARVVGEKYGLERGDSMAETKAKHRSTEEYKRSLVNEVCSLEDLLERLRREIRQQEIKVKGLSTMIANLERERESIRAEIAALAEKYVDNNVEMQSELAALRERMADVEAKLLDKGEKLAGANASLASAREQLELLQVRNSRLSQENRELGGQLSDKYRFRIHTAMNMELSDALQRLLPSCSPQQLSLLEDSGVMDLLENQEKVVKCALLLVAGYVDMATDFAESQGGGGVSSDLGWGRDPHEDDEDWWRRCLGRAGRMMKPAGRGRGGRR